MKGESSLIKKNRQGINIRNIQECLYVLEMDKKRSGAPNFEKEGGDGYK